MTLGIGSPSGLGVKNMAKLSAHGIEVLRYSKEKRPTVEQDSLCDWERNTTAIMSDGKMLTKLDVNFRQSTASAAYDARTRHSYGWKLKGKLKKDHDLARLRDKAIAAGYTIEVDNVGKVTVKA